MGGFYIGIIVSGVLFVIYILIYNIYIRFYVPDNYSSISEV